MMLLMNTRPDAVIDYVKQAFLRVCTTFVAEAVHLFSHQACSVMACSSVCTVLCLQATSFRTNCAMISDAMYLHTVNSQSLQHATYNQHCCMCGVLVWSQAPDPNADPCGHHTP
jgi:hypothetical protein